MEQPSEHQLTLSEKIVALRELDELISFEKLKDYRPYERQREFHTMGAWYRERLLMAANQVGKTLAGGAEAAIHATGRYPDWWEGRVIDHENYGWVAGLTGELLRDGAQRILMGRAEQGWGTGMIPKDALKDIIRRPHGVKDSLEGVVVRWGGGGDVQAGESRIGFKAYEAGREKFQSETLDWGWLDEEPDAEIYTEMLTRTNAGDRGKMGFLFMTFTPLLGMSETVERFIIDEKEGTCVVGMTLADAEHYTPAQRQAIYDSYPAHERDARAKGIPALGSGKVFPVSEHTITVDPFVPPAIWPRIGGLDFGWDHPSAAVLLAHDRDSDTLYVCGIHRQKEATPVIFAEGIKPWGKWLPWAWPHDGLQHEKGSGVQLAELYRKQDMNLWPTPASFSDEKLDNSTEAGVTGMLDMMQSGRFKVMSHLREWFEEFRTYHRKDGIIVKKRDDLLSATRMAYMMRRHARKKPSTKPHDPRPPNWRTA